MIWVVSTKDLFLNHKINFKTCVKINNYYFIIMIMVSIFVNKLFLPPSFTQLRH